MLTSNPAGTASSRASRLLSRDAPSMACRPNWPVDGCQVVPNRLAGCCSSGQLAWVRNSRISNSTTAAVNAQPRLAARNSQSRLGRRDKGVLIDKVGHLTGLGEGQ
jgi:hypothetical protein